ncbi:MAG: metallophosphoesterase [Anaerolineales bacterium]
MKRVKILAVSDEENERVTTLIREPPFCNAALILGCGDLPYSYLEYLVTMLNVPLAYVPGNHDPAYHARDPSTFAEGCINLDGRVARVNGLLLAGLGGSIRYRPGENQYTQGEMFLRVWRLLPSLLLNRIFHHRWLDIFITHSPPFGIHDQPGTAHEGFRAFNWLLRLTSVPYHFHGHFHFTLRNLSPNTTRYGATLVVNAFPYRLMEVTLPFAP